jgi:hypothetical protein
MFEKIAAAAGAPIEAVSMARLPPPVPPTLLAAAADPPRDGSPVRLAVDGTDVIAVVGDEGGDPREWWAAIRRVSGRPTAS